MLTYFFAADDKCLLIFLLMIIHMLTYLFADDNTCLLIYLFIYLFLLTIINAYLISIFRRPSCSSCEMAIENQKFIKKKSIEIRVFLYSSHFYFVSRFTKLCTVLVINIFSYTLFN